MRAAAARHPPLRIVAEPVQQVEHGIRPGAAAHRSRAACRRRSHVRRSRRPNRKTCRVIAPRGTPAAGSHGFGPGTMNMRSESCQRTSAPAGSPDRSSSRRPRRTSRYRCPASSASVVTAPHALLVLLQRQPRPPAPRHLLRIRRAQAERDAPSAPISGDFSGAPPRPPACGRRRRGCRRRAGRGGAWRHRAAPSRTGQGEQGAGESWLIHAGIPTSRNNRPFHRPRILRRRGASYSAKRPFAFLYQEASEVP